MQKESNSYQEIKDEKSSKRCKRKLKKDGKKGKKSAIKKKTSDDEV